MLISTAWAQEATGDAAAGAAAAPGGGDMLMTFVPLILIFVVFYFLLIRPQQKKMKAHRAMVASARRGDRVVTQGGIIGVVTKDLGENELMVEIAEGVRVKVLKHTLSDILNRSDSRATATPSAPAQDESSGGGGLLGRFKKSNG
ncbi:MAG: preprotein translocase subunit YajC [Alphaproteobacteria bacterium]